MTSPTTRLTFFATCDQAVPVGVGKRSCAASKRQTATLPIIDIRQLCFCRLGTHTQRLAFALGGFFSSSTRTRLTVKDCFQTRDNAEASRSIITPALFEQAKGIQKGGWLAGILGILPCFRWWRIWSENSVAQFPSYHVRGEERRDPNQIGAKRELNRRCHQGGCGDGSQCCCSPAR